MNFHTLLLTNIGTTNSVITDTIDRYEPIIMFGGVGNVGGDFSHTANSVMLADGRLLTYFSLA